MYKSLLLILFLWICFHVSAQDANSLYDQAQLKMEAGKYKEAVGLFTKAIDKKGDDEKFYIGRSRAYFKLNDFEKSFQDLNTAIKINPKSHEAYAERGQFYYLIRQAEKSIMDYTLAIEHAPHDTIKSNYLSCRVGSKQLKRDAKGASQDCYEALKLDSLNKAALNNLAMVLDDLGKDEEVLVYLKKIIALDSTAGYAWMNIGFKLSNMGRYEESLPYFNKALQLIRTTRMLIITEVILS
jgi:tetratricopeptide (TPR) repeat protein